MIETTPETEKVVIVGLIYKSQDKKQAMEYLDELEFLANTAGAKVLKRFTQKMEVPNVSTFVGPGKLEEIGKYIKVVEADTVIFDDELTPTQLRNVERRLDCKILDRTNLILDIFNSSRKNTGCTGTISIPSSPPYAHVDPPRTSARGYWNARSR